MFYITRRDGSIEDYYRVEQVKGAKEREEEKKKEEKKRERKHKRKEDEVTAVIAQDVMNRSKTISEEESLHHAWDLISKGNFASLPVISKEGKLIGIVTGRDVAKEMEKSGEKKHVRDVMKTDVISASDDTDVGEIAQLFFEKRVHMLPIIDNQARVIGVVTPGDLLGTIIKVSKLRD